MAIRNDLTVNWGVSPRIITIAAPSVEITMQDLLDTLRYMESQPGAMDDASIVDASGKENLGGGTKVGLTVKLLNAKLAFEARGGPSWVLCQITGGNCVAVDADGNDMDVRHPTAYVTIDRVSSASATLQEQADIQYSSYNGGVTLDVTGSYSGTEYPIGTPRQPVNNLVDAMLIATQRGFTTIFVIGDCAIDNSGDYTGMTFIGESADKTELDIADGANVYKCEFYEARVMGTLDGDAVLVDCVIHDLTYISGFVKRCVLMSGTVVLGEGAVAHFLDCYSSVPTPTVPTIDCGGSGQSLVMRNYNGDIKLVNKSGPEGVTIDLNSGQVVLDSTVTAGLITVRGVGELTDNSDGAVVDSRHLLQGDTVQLTRQIVQNKLITDPVTGIMTLYDDAGNPLLQGPLYEDVDGDQPYRGRGAERRERLEPIP